jgi:hypothetical protein
MLDYYQDRPFYIKGQPGAINNWDFDILTMPIIVLDQINKHFQKESRQKKSLILIRMYFVSFRRITSARNHGRLKTFA